MTQARKRISLVLVNGIPRARKEIASLIRAQPGFHVLVPSADVKETLRQLRATLRACILHPQLRQKGVENRVERRIGRCN